MSFNTIRENKILAKISEFTVIQASYRLVLSKTRAHNYSHSLNLNTDFNDVRNNL